MGTGSTFLLFTFIGVTLIFAGNGEQVTHRETLEIIIGGGGPAFSSPPPEDEYCPPPLPPPCPPPPPPPCPPPMSPPSPPPPPKKSPPPPPRKPPPPPPSPPKKPPPPPPSPPKKPPSPPKKPPPRSPPPLVFENERLKLAYKVIQRFKNKITIDPFHIRDTWVGSNVCGYKGIICDIEPTQNEKTLAGLKFNGYNFYGPDLTITGLVNCLPDIVFFHANSNNFTGTIPADINKLKYFYELDLSNNNYAGRFPYEVIAAKDLLFLDLRFNKFAGVVPPEVFGLELDLLFINNNNFIQKLPDNLGNTTALYLTLANNKFVGGIPPSIGQACNTLLEVLFLNNQLTGCLPYQIGLLYKATVFDVGTNMLHGPIPHSFQCLKEMQLLNLAHNNFSGAVPEAVCSLPKLSNFTISYNYFTQVGPQCRKLIKNGVLNVKMNCILDLPNQRSKAECESFFSRSHSSCPDEKFYNYVPCKVGLSGTQVESSEIQSTVYSPAPALAQAPRRGSYGALSPH